MMTTKRTLSPEQRERKRLKDKELYQRNRKKRLQQAKSYRDSHKEQSREYLKEYREKNREKLLDAKKKYYLEHSEISKERSKIWAKNNPDRVRLRGIEYRKSHIEELKETIRRWRQNNKDKRLVSNQNRRARKKNLNGKVTVQEWNELLNFYGYKCLRCGRSDVKLTQDHVVPLSKGGLHHVSNIQPLCVSCNSSKHTDTVDYRK